ncbi:redoxin domain-containing protein [Hyphococcus lacteus]|uniref:Redoxin domain-containing protein n=1 Tax=Hyphococcus lacteus TaxID=3143536 RepID=A0ABV3Z4E2_9PROT
MTNSKPVPGKKAPSLEVQTQNGVWSLFDQTPDNFTAIFFYRGLHCPICKKQLEELEAKCEKFNDAGTNVIALSMDSEVRWRKSRSDWEVDELTIGHSVSEQTARNWGLYISEAIKDGEPDIFSEPGIFLVKPDGTLYLASIQSAPFARPSIDDLLSAIDFVTEKEYPARGQKT